MTLLNGIRHLTALTADLDRLIAFYARVFDARVTGDLEEDGLRHTFVELGPATVPHPFQVPGVEVQHEIPMFQRGRLDHLGLNAASEEAHRLDRCVPGRAARAPLQQYHAGSRRVGIHV